MHYAKSKTTGTKGNILYDSIFMKYPEWANIQRQKQTGR